MLLSFQRMFAFYVWEGTKEHTVRGLRPANAPQWRPGRTVDAYVDARQKTMMRLGAWWCIRVQPIEIWPAKGAAFRIAIAIDGVELGFDEANGFAYRDGFRIEHPDYSYLDQMTDFWVVHNKMNPLAPKWNGQLITWEYDQATRADVPPPREWIRREVYMD